MPMTKIMQKQKPEIEVQNGGRPFSSVLGQEVPKIHANINESNIFFKCMQIDKIFASLRKLRLRNRIVTSDFKLEVEIWPYCACAIKICNIPNNRYYKNSSVIVDL